MGECLKLVSHKLCPYVQRAVIALTEKGASFERIDIDLAHKPDWFVRLSPLGKTPVLLVGDTAVFESAVILEYLEETRDKPLHPADALRRAEHRAWIEFGSAVLNDIAGLYAAPDEAVFKAKAAQLEARFARLEARSMAAPWFDGAGFSLVDAVFGPVFRYFDVFDTIGDFGILAGKPKLARWREALAARSSVRSAVGADYPALLRDFLERRGSYLSRLQARAAA
ncbi:MAG: glutathione S-transferase family protein [Bradyrhizobium sp.]|uniref:glutathione S-transferase family protein n=1 Tax=Bradyrhizobium sp. TaxID=376 RepID=UPI001D86C834|nr:glutathione S-transferase family protein [Bradyrhizobium sp.]MBV9562733.1 glutathione S-transferase family protein [Bradyrhizobium sp.]